MKCPNCQRDNPEGVKFCGGGGRSLQMESTCSKCGRIITSDVQFCHQCGQPLTPVPTSPAANPTPPAVKPLPTSASVPTSFVDGRYQVKKFLGEGGKEKVYLTHDTTLDINVAFALIETESWMKLGEPVSSARHRRWADLATTPTTAPSLYSAMINAGC